VRAIDTNVVVRLLTGDDSRQSEKARVAIEAGDIRISTTVLLESEWVLRGAYGFAPDQIVAALAGIAGLPGVTIEEPAMLVLALEWLVAGLDFADALHLAKAEGCGVFLSFDRKLARKAAGLSAVPVEAP
jgi:predicted nucleic-acid-binding protein